MPITLTPPTYTATLVSVQYLKDFPNNSSCTINFFKDGKLILTDSEDGFSSIEEVQKYCRDKIAKLTEQDAIDAFVANPPLGDIDFALPQPTAKEIADQDFNQKLGVVADLSKQVDLGIIHDKTDNDYMDALSLAITAKNVVKSLLQDNPQLAPSEVNIISVT